MSNESSKQAVGVDILRHLLAAANAGTGEVALLDVREEGQFGEAHALLAVNRPLSRLELDVPKRVPRRSAQVVLIAGAEANDELAQRAARRLQAIGYTQVAWLAGGIDSWSAAGEPLFSGVNVPSKAFAECVEHGFHTPAIKAADLDRRRKAGEKIVILDSRTAEEHARFHVPGAISCPSAELALRVDDLVPADTSLLVISCAGRTRGIIGAQALINAGYSRPIAALEGGTQGWRLAGFQTVPGADGPLAPPSAAALETGAERARLVTDNFAIPHIDHATLATWRQDDAHTTYTFDVRLPPAYAQGHLPDFTNVAGGQIVQTLDLYAATRGARVVLSDDAPGLRAVVTAHWLRQLGWNAVVLDDAHDQAKGAPALVRDDAAGTAAKPSAAPTPGWNDLPVVSLDEADQWLASGAVVLDAGSSASHAKGHVPGAQWTPRALLTPARLEALGRPSRVLLASDDERLSRLAAVELQELASQGLFTGQFALVQGGLTAWRDSGRSVQAAAPLAREQRIDFLFWLHDRHEGNAASSQAYLEWEADLPRQVGWPDKSPFTIGPRAA